MRCRSCGENVDESRSIAIEERAAELVEYELQPQTETNLADLRFHLVYLPGILPEAPATMAQHIGPLICGPVEEA